LKLALALLSCAALLSGCRATEDLVVLGTTVVTWPGAGGATDGQVIVRIRNDGDQPIDPDVLGRGRQTAARLLDADGDDISGGDARVQLSPAPNILDPGETGYLLGAFELADAAGGVSDARVELNAAVADARTRVTVEDFEINDGPDGVGASGRLEWDGSGSAVARAIALDADGAPIGYVATAEVRYSPGDITMCCFPPTIDRADIDEVLVFGVRARSEN
jgi:hypothetical protein